MVAINGAVADIEAIRGTETPLVETLLDVYVETLSMEKVKEKQEELEVAAKKASLTTVEEAVEAIETSVQAPVIASQVIADTEAGAVMRVYASQNQINQISDFMKAIGVRYELL